MNNFYITTPIYYVNDSAHIGHAYTTIACDILSRYQKLNNKKVFFLTGTDEHGLKIEKSAKNSGVNTGDFVNKVSQTFRDLVPFLGCEVDDFIRTTEKRHHNSVNDLWNRLVKSVDIYLSKYKGWYSISDEAYYNEDEVIEKEGKKISTFSGSIRKACSKTSTASSNFSSAIKLIPFLNNFLIL